LYDTLSAIVKLVLLTAVGEHCLFKTLESIDQILEQNELKQLFEAGLEAVHQFGVCFLADYEHSEAKIFFFSVCSVIEHGQFVLLGD
jgi:hypothetical protein